MDFRNDLYEIAKQLLDRCDVDTSCATKDRDFIQMYMNIRLIESCKYKGMFYSLSCAYLKKPLIRSLS